MKGFPEPPIKGLKPLVALAFALFFFNYVSAESSLPAFFEGLKSDIFVRAGSSGIFTDDVTAGNDFQFGGMYATFVGNVSSDYFQVYAKSKVKLSSADKIDDLSTSASWEKAYLALSMPFFRPLWLYGGKGFALATPGAYLSVADDYSDGTRWGKDGVALLLRAGLAEFGAGFYSTSTSYKLKEKLQLGSGLNLDFKKFDVPLKIGFSAAYNNGKHYETTSEKTLSTKKYETEGGEKTKIYETQTVYDYGSLFIDERDWTGAVSVQARKGFLTSLTLGYAINAAPMTASSAYRRVENYSEKSLQSSHVLTLSSRWKIRSGDFWNVGVEQEAEWAKAFDTDFGSLYAALRLKQKVAGILHAYPGAMFYSIYDRADSGGDRTSLVLYPRLTLEGGAHYFVAGVQIERREMAADEFHWRVSVPFYYKFSLK